MALATFAFHMLTQLIRWITSMPSTDLGHEKRSWMVFVVLMTALPC